MQRAVDAIAVKQAGESKKYSNGYDRVMLNTKWSLQMKQEISSKHSDILTIKIRDENHELIINLVKVNHHLANEHLPVWKTSSENRKEYQELHEVMHQVGKFTMYRDYKTKSAFVYFHKRDELEGVINRRYFIRHLPKRKLHQVHEVNDKYVFLQGRKFYPIDNELTENEETQFDKSMGRIRNGRMSRELAPEVFPELLVAISYDMFIAIEEHSHAPLGVNTVSHVLVTFNAVDMLYHLVESATININIAGIVIEASEDHWGFVKSLAIGETMKNGVRVNFIVDAENITMEISNYFRKREEYFPRDSYDFIIYNTRNQLSYLSVNVMGIAWHSGFSYMYPPGQDYDRINVAVQDHESYINYVVIAHELAHAMNVEHDAIDESAEVSTAHESLMYCYKSQCVHGLAWSEDSEKTFMQYFRSPAHCILRNHPRSLHYPKRRQTLSALEQCQCYGFESNQKAKPEDECVEPIVCLDDDNKKLLHVTQFPIDGTPCGNNSWINVCWEEKCVRADT